MVQIDHGMIVGAANVAQHVEAVDGVAPTTMPATIEGTFTLEFAPTGTVHLYVFTDQAGEVAPDDAPNASSGVHPAPRHQISGR